MIYQMLPNLISLIIGSVLTLAVTYFSQTMTRKGEKKKIVREKLEEAYILLGELRYWLRIQRYRVIVEGTKDVSNLYINKFGSAFWVSGEFKPFELDSIKCDCPIERIVMLISLYVPTLRNTAHEYEIAFSSLTTSLAFLFDPEILEMKKEYKDVYEVIAPQLEQATKSSYIGLLRCEKPHKTLQSSLEKIIAEI